jgi:putative transposase
MSRNGRDYDNAVAERFFWSPKHEWTNHEAFGNLSVARLSMFKYAETVYNTERIHATLGYKGPTQYEADRARATAV